MNSQELEIPPSTDNRHECFPWCHSLLHPEMWHGYRCRHLYCVFLSHWIVTQCGSTGLRALGQGIGGDQRVAGWRVAQTFYSLHGMCREERAVGWGGGSTDVRLSLPALPLLIHLLREGSTWCEPLEPIKLQSLACFSAFMKCWGLFSLFWKAPWSPSLKFYTTRFW